MVIRLTDIEKDLILMLIKGQRLVPAEKRELIGLEVVLEEDQQERQGDK